MDFFTFLTEGDQFYKSGQANEARIAWGRASSAATSPQDLLTVTNRFLSLGFLSEAEAALERLPANESLASALAARSALALESGDVAKARSILEAGSALQDLRLMSNAILIRHYEKPIDPLGILKASRLWADKARSQSPVLEAPKAPQGPRPNKYRIGFVSGDLCAHPVGFLIAPILRAFQAHSDNVDVFIFDNGMQNDWMTQHLKKSCPQDHWHNIATINDRDASRLILSSDLDCLIDCSGHTSRSRLALFVNRLSPIQLSWGGYFSTTGLDTIDAVIMDDFHLSTHSKNYFIEKVIRIPSRFIYAPPSFCPPVTDSPYFRCGTITFGSFNNIAKINKDVTKTWSNILLSIPQSRLILKWRGLIDDKFQNYIRSSFNEHGVDPSRIELRPFSIYRDTLAEYRDIDIALDPFPFTGGQTSLDALWMGVPLITLAGETPIERQGHCFVNLIGRPEWSTSNPNDYIQKTIELAKDPDTLRNMRFDQRDMIRKSPLSDASLFVSSLLAWLAEHKTKTSP